MTSRLRRRFPPLVVGVVLLCAGCAGMHPQGAPPRGAKAAAALPTIGTDLTNSPGGGMTADVLYTLLVAEIAGQRGKLDVAVDNYLKLVQAIPNAKLAERATKVAVFARQDDKALDAAQRWVQLDGKNLEARQVLAALLIHAGRLDEAVSHLEVVLGSEQGNSSQRMWAIANILSREQDKQAAVTVMEKLMDRRGRSSDALFTYALLAIRAEQVDKARAAMDQVTAFTPANVGVAVAYVGVLQKQGETATALKWLETVLSKQPAQNDLRLIYARLLADSKRYDDSRDQFLILEKVEPGSADVQYALGLLSLQSGRTQDAVKHFQKLVELGEHADDARFYLGQIAEADKDFDKARRWYSQVAGGENQFESQLRVALMLARQNKVAAAQNHLHSVTAETDEQKERLTRAEGEILVEAGKYREAMAIYDRALEGGRYDSELLYTRAMLAEKMDRVDILERDLRQILEHDPKNSQALNALGYTLADRTSRYQEAHDLIKRALDLSPNDFYILDSMGWVLYRLGRLDEAIAYLKRARDLRDDPEVAAHLAEVLWVKGDKDAARNVWESALKTAPGDKSLLRVIERFGP